MFHWPVVPICEKQRRDVNPEDLLCGGLYRKCDVYKGGGGYDQFPKIHKRRFGYELDPVQFVVQLRGCPMECSYCYVTEDGVWGTPEMIATKELVEDFIKSGCQVFHLMGGAPALYLENWKELAGWLCCQSAVPAVFHSDFLLVEGPYQRKWLEDLPGLHVVSVKDFPVNEKLFWKNLDLLVETGVYFYITFTGNPVKRDSIRARYGDWILEDSFCIDVKPYKALEN